jgi:hypothetical protein
MSVTTIRRAGTSDYNPAILPEVLPGASSPQIGYRRKLFRTSACGPTISRIFAAALVLALGGRQGAADQPPTTPSDANGNTANGTSALLNIVSGGSGGFRNTGTGYGALFSNTTGTNNTASGFQALYSNTTGYSNTAIGLGALFSNTTGSGNTASGQGALTDNTTGNANTASGAGALLSNTIGYQNTANGTSSLASNRSGYSNTASGAQALFANTAGYDNTAVGYNALSANTTGHSNIAVGHEALKSSTGGVNNVAVGNAAMFNGTGGNQNVAVGLYALYRGGAGSSNIALGYQAGFNLTSGSSNIYISSPGRTTESLTTRIGSAQTRAFVAGIRGVTTGLANAVTLVVDGNGQLGTINSSARFKENVRDMAGYSGRLYDLRPVTYRYKEPHADGSKPEEPGLIAEEVAEIYPDLVTYDSDGQVETVQYHKLTPMLLNEIQRQQRLLKAQGDEIDALQAEARRLEAALAEQNARVADRLAKLEAASTAIASR